MSAQQIRAINEHPIWTKRLILEKVLVSSEAVNTNPLMLHNLDDDDSIYKPDDWYCVFNIDDLCTSKELHELGMKLLYESKSIPLRSSRRWPVASTEASSALQGGRSIAESPDPSGEIPDSDERALRTTARNNMLTSARSAPATVLDDQTDTEIGVANGLNEQVAQPLSKDGCRYTAFERMRSGTLFHPTRESFCRMEFFPHPGEIDGSGDEEVSKASGSDIDQLADAFEDSDEDDGWNAVVGLQSFEFRLPIEEDPHRTRLIMDSDIFAGSFGTCREAVVAY